jgi:single stranded DNA-binding protein
MAASNINSVVVTGNLTRDPELRHTPGGTPVCKLRIAVNTRRKSSDGNWEDKPNYFDVTVWGAQGENCSTYLVKGRPVAISGRLEWREWEGEGGKRQAVEIIADGPVPRQPRRLERRRGQRKRRRWLCRRRLRPARRHLGLRLAGARVGRFVVRRRHPVLARQIQSLGGA